MLSSDWLVYLSWESVHLEQEISPVYWALQVKVKEQINDRVKARPLHFSYEMAGRDTIDKT